MATPPTALSAVRHFADNEAHCSKVNPNGREGSANLAAQLSAIHRNGHLKRAPVRAPLDCHVAPNRARRWRPGPLGGRTPHSAGSTASVVQFIPRPEAPRYSLIVEVNALKMRSSYAIIVNSLAAQTILRSAISSCQNQPMGAARAAEKDRRARAAAEQAEQQRLAAARAEEERERSCSASSLLRRALGAKLTRGLISEAAAGFRSRRGLSYDDSAPVTPHNAPFPTYKVA